MQARTLKLTPLRGMDRIVLLIICGMCASGCAMKKIAINKLGDTLSSGGTTFASDDDPELIKAALPFTLKMMESLLAEVPEHRGLLNATASGFTQYSYAFILQEAERIEDDDIDAAFAMRNRVRRMSLRARDYGLRGLEAAHEGFVDALQEDPREAVRAAAVDDVSFLYWTAAAWASAISVSKDDPNMIADLQTVEALIDRALELDEDFADGAIHSFLITYEMARPGGEGDPSARSRKHFERARELSDSQMASPFVSLAEAVAVPAQDRAHFESLLNAALAVDPDARMEWRLANVIAQERARWLLARTDRIFLE